MILTQVKVILIPEKLAMVSGTAFRTKNNSQNRKPQLVYSTFTLTFMHTFKTRPTYKTYAEVINY